MALAVPAAVSARDFYSDVRPMLVENCVGCHSEAGIPPWLADKGHQEYLGDLSLSDDVIGMVAAWRDAGFPKGDARPDAIPTEVTSFAFNSDLSLDVLPGEAYPPRRDMDDDYRCFVVDWARDEPGYVTGFRAVPGNDLIAHHVVVHVVEPDMVKSTRWSTGPGMSASVVRFRRASTGTRTRPSTRMEPVS
jgi:hypothetical protein